MDDAPQLLAFRVDDVEAAAATAVDVAFGGDDWKTLYFTTASALFSVNVKIAGVPVPAKRTT